MIEQNYNLNLIPGGVPAVVKASQYDKTSRTINFSLYNGDVAFNVPTGASVYVQGTKPDNTGFQYACTFTDNIVSFGIEDQMTVLSGEYQAEIRITKDGDILGTANFVFAIEKAGLSDDTVISETELPLIEEAIEKAQDAIDSALKSEGYAVGTQDGEPVSSDSPYYENNAKYYAEYMEQYTTKIYGVKRSLTSSDSTWERTNDSIGLNANATHDGTAVANDFDNLYPWCDIKTVNMADNGTINAEIGDANFKFDGSNGEVMTRIPPFYYSREQDASYEYIKISNRYFEGAKHSPQFYIGRYTTSSGVHSKSGVSSQVSQNITTFRQQATAKGTGWQQLDYHYFLLQMLYLVEYADGNSQSKLGQGNCSTSAQITLGGCDSLGMKSGCLANAGATSVIYRGIENIFGNIWQFVDGLNIKDNAAYICYKPSSYAVDTFTGDYSALGYTNATANGNPNKMGYDANNPMVALPSVVGTSTYGDYYWQNTGNRIAHVGGAWDFGASDGLFCWYLADDSLNANTHIGSRLLKI